MVDILEVSPPLATCAVPRCWEMKAELGAQPGAAQSLCCTSAVTRSPCVAVQEQYEVIDLCDAGWSIQPAVSLLYSRQQSLC